MADAFEQDESAKITDYSEHYGRMAELIYATSPELKDEYNRRALGVIKLLREKIPELSDDSALSVLASVAYLLSVILMTPLAHVGKETSELFDIYSLAAAAVTGAVDLTDESEPKTLAEMEREALMSEIERLRGELANGGGGTDEQFGLYL